MNQNEAVIRDERERFIKENRKRLMQEEAEKKEKKALQQSKKGYHPLKDLMTSVKDKLNQKSLTDVTSLNLTDFPEPMGGEGAAMFSQRENTAQEGAVEGEACSETGCKDTVKPSQLQDALEHISGRYAVVAFTCADVADAEIIVKTGLSVLSTAIYPMGNIYIAILSDCWQNKNTLNKLMDDLAAEFKKETDKELLTVCLGATDEENVNERLKHTVNALNRKLRNLTAPNTDSDLEALQTRLKRQIESNAIEQAKRQFERQLEEDGEIDEDLPVIIREAKNMSEDEYDSYLSEEEQEIKYNARKNYIDDDVSIEQTLHNIKKHNTMDDPLYLIAVASVDMNTLIILEDTDDFEDLCEEADVTMMRCSYIYAISKSGGHWYGNNHATRDIEDIFESLSEIIRSRGGRFRREFLYDVPNISIFKDIYLQ